MIGEEKNGTLPGKDTLYKDLVEHSHNLVQCVDSEGRFVYINQAWLKTLKYNAEEAANLNMWQIIHPGSVEHCKAIFEQVVTGKDVGDIEAVFVAKDGTQVAVEGSVSVKLNEKGRFLQTRGIFSDVTESKKAEEALRDSEQRASKQRAAIAELVIDESIVKGETAVALNKITKVSAKAIDVERSSIWILNECGEELRCLSLYEATTGNLSSGTILEAKKMPRYFAAIKEESRIYAENAQADHRTSEMTENYLKPLGITSLLDAGIVVDGELLGVICLEHVGAPRQWQADEEAFASTVASLVAQLFITEERKKAEEELQQRSEQVRVILDTVPSYIFAKDIDGRFLLANKAVADVFGVEPEQVEGKTDLDYGATEDQMRAYNLIDRGIIESGESLLIPEEQIMRKDGTMGWFQTLKIPYSHPGWDKPAILGVATDITERKQAEEEVASTNKMLEMVMNNIPQFIFWKDRNSVYLGCNENQAKVAGLNYPHEIVGKTDYDLPWKKEEADFFREVDQRIMDSGVAEYNIIEPQLQSDGKQAWLNTSKIPLFNKDGNVIGILGTYEDITERRKAEEALRTSELRNRALVEAIPDLLFRFNSEGVYLDAAVKNEDLLYSKVRVLYKRNALIGKNLHEVLPAAIANSLMAGIEDTLKSGAMQQTEYSYNLQNVEHHFETRLSAIGKTEVVAIVRDITERRHADENIRYLSYHDQLTGLYNRHFLEEEMNRLDTERQLPISMIMADLNGLKLVNDTYGHHLGDEILKKAADILKNACREDDMLARFGGDEFVLYLPRTPEKEAYKIRTRIEKACHRELVNDVPISISTGLAVKASIDQKLADLLKEAEDNMYRDKLTESRSGKSAIVNSLLQTLAAKSYETESHTRNMQEAAKNIGEKLSLPRSELYRLQLLIILHDIGKINIPEELLTKKGALSPPEWEVMKKHCETGYRIAKATENFAHVAEDILAHHERWDGSGYPQGLKGEAIPILSRITAIADAFEVMSNGRPYKKAMSKDEIVKEFINCSGTHFDPELVEHFLSILKSDG